jgi:hypothetical protein
MVAVVVLVATLWANWLTLLTFSLHPESAPSRDVAAIVPFQRQRVPGVVLILSVLRVSRQAVRRTRKLLVFLPQLRAEQGTSFPFNIPMLSLPERFHLVTNRSFGVLSGPPWFSLYPVFALLAMPVETHAGLLQNTPRDALSGPPCGGLSGILGVSVPF